MGPKSRFQIYINLAVLGNETRVLLFCFTDKYLAISHLRVNFKKTAWILKVFYSKIPFEWKNFTEMWIKIHFKRSLLEVAFVTIPTTRNHLNARRIIAGCNKAGNFQTLQPPKNYHGVSSNCSRKGFPYPSTGSRALFWLDFRL
jgi:hypothetical protein